MASPELPHWDSLGVGSSHRAPRDPGATSTSGQLMDEPSSPSSSEIDDDVSSVASSFFDPPDDLTHKLSAIQLPDLRFEQGYLTSLTSCFHFHQPNQSSKTHHTSHSQKPSEIPLSDQDQGSQIPPDLTADNQTTADYFYLGSNFHVDWKMVAYITIRDQLVYPLLQGYLWGSASLFLSYIWSIRSHQRLKRSQRHSLKPNTAITPKVKTMWDRITTGIFG